MKRKNIKIHFKPDKTIADNAKDIGVSYDTIKKYMQRNGLSKQGFNFNNRLLKLKQLKDDLEKKGIKPTIQELKNNLGWGNKTVLKYLNILKENSVEMDNKILPFFTLKKQEQLIKSVAHNQNTIIENIIQLFIPTGQIECDLTFSTGVFYKKNIPTPIYKFDKYPIDETIKPLDEIIYLTDNSLNSIIADPPFIIDNPYKVASNKKRVVGINRMVDRFNAFKSPKELELAYDFLIQQSYRILNKNGILVFKCMSTVSGYRQIDTPFFVKKTCLEYGFEFIDEFVLIAKSKALHGRHIKQNHSRKYHTFFLVFKKK